ncbi:MAG: YggS family pyridoxal phosphate-dependent enzyme [bacterium]|nr:YggS family pyridoxal phosphate-dependent enzyme [bacterium]MCP5067570.1 YggS family pyridoxal phosphate-dependent enzyme [bacterium]
MSAAGDRLARVRDRICDAAARAHRDPDEVTLLGVSKRQPLERVLDAVEAGLGQLGENYAQEARDKRPDFEAGRLQRNLPEPRWHFVGQLQRNKARLVVPLFDVVETVDRTALAIALDRSASSAGRVLDVLLQVDLSGEATDGPKGGVEPDALPTLLADVSGLEHLRVVGLMAIPAAQQDPEATRPAFARLRALRDDLSSRPEGRSLRELSMGMSGDFEVAIEEGATIVRVGTALFGARDS